MTNAGNSGKPERVVVNAYARRLINPIRAYLAVPCALRHLINAVNLLLFPSMFPHARLIPVVGVFPLSLWGILFGLTGVFALIGAALNNRSFARAALIASAALTLAVGGGIILGAAVFQHAGGHPSQTPYPPIAVFVLALAAADLCVLGGRWVPMTSESETKK